jgi:serine/threonine-protein kinase RsbW
VDPVTPLADERGGDLSQEPASTSAATSAVMDHGSTEERCTDDGLRTSTPPDDFALEREWVVDTPRQLSELRAAIVRALAAEGEPVRELAGTAHIMVLVASELATNALRHGIPPTVVRLLRSEGTYLLDVADHDLGSTPYVAGARPPGQGGFGLQIARRLALEVGWYATETTKHVWATFPVAGPEAPRGVSGARTGG